MSDVLSERTWFTRLKATLVTEGWQPLAIKLWPARLIFFKRVNRLFLTLAIETSRSDGPKVTASLYLAPSFSWPLAGGDYPSQAYLRVGELVSHDEYPHLGLPAPISEDDIDAWWPGYSERSLVGLASAIKLAESRFLQQAEIESLVENSERLQGHLKLVYETMSALAGGRLGPLPHKIKIDPSVPLEWYQAAARVLALRGEIVRSEKVKFIAEDAWCLASATAPRRQ
jgi:hypothetical protein